MALDEYKTQVLLLHSEQSTLDALSTGWSDKYSVHLATTGTEALNIFNDTPVNIIVSAHKLPGMSGLDALRAAKKISPETMGILLAGTSTDDGLESMVGEQEMFQIVRGNVTVDDLLNLIEGATTRSRILALAESANDGDAGVDTPVAEHIVMETSEHGAAIVSDHTGQVPALKPDKVSVAAGSAGRAIDVLVLTKDEEFLATIRDSSVGLHDVHHCVTPSQTEAIVNNNTVGVLVTDAAMVGSKIEVLTQRLRLTSPRLVAVVAGRRDDGELLMDLINRGQVYRFLLKPVSPGRARLAIEASVKHHLEADDSAFRVAAHPTPQNKPGATATPTPKRPTTPQRQAKASESTPVVVTHRDKVVSDRLDEAFGDDSSFTETLTGLAVNFTKKLADKGKKAKARKQVTKDARPKAVKPQPKVRPQQNQAAQAITAPARRQRTAEPAQQARIEPKMPSPVAKAKPSPRKRQSATIKPRSPSTEFDPLAGNPRGRFGNLKLLGLVGVVLLVVVVGAWYMLGEDAEPPAQQPDQSVSSPLFDETEILLPRPTTAEPAPEFLEKLNAARDAVADGRIIDPQTDNAVEYYVSALTMEPAHLEANAELAAVIEQVVSMAETAILEHRLEDASITLRMIERGSPDNPRLTFLNAQLDQLQLRDATDKARLAIREQRFEDAGRMIERAAGVAGESTDEIRLLSEELSSARSEQRVDDVLEMAAERLERSQLISPSNDNARYYYELALSSDPDNTAARQGLTLVAGKLVLQARTAIDAGQLVNAEDLLRNARLLDPSSEDLATATAALADVRTANAQAEQAARDEAARLEAERQEAVRLEAERVEAERIAEEQAEEERQRAVAVAAAAALAAQQSVAEESSTTATASGTDAGAAADKPAAGSTETYNTGQPEPAAAATLAATNPNLPSATDAAPKVEKAAGVPREPQVVPISQLTRTNYVPPKYPRSAQRRNVTGSVDVAFTVDTNGSVSDIQVLDSKPGTIFDAAAMEAVAQWQFEPTFTDGRAVRMRTAVRLAFNLQ